MGLKGQKQIKEKPFMQETYKMNNIKTSLKCIFLVIGSCIRFDFDTAVSNLKMI